MHVLYLYGRGSIWGDAPDFVSRFGGIEAPAQTLVKKGERQKSEGRWGKEEGEVASWLS